MIKKSYKAKLAEHLTHSAGEKRWVIINPETNEVLDDNKGDGYATESKAINHYEVKTFGKSHKAEERHAGKVEKFYSQKADSKHDISENLDYSEE